MTAHPDASTVSAILARYWAITAVDIRPLPGEHDANYHVSATDGSEYGFKIHADYLPSSDSDMQIAVLRHLREVASALPLQTLITGEHGDLVTVILPSGASRQARLCRWLNGEVWASNKSITTQSLRDLGRALGQLDRALVQFDHQAAHRPYQWNSLQFAQLAPFVDYVDDREKRQALLALHKRFNNVIAATLAQCPTQVIHNDANDYNVLLDQQGRLSGVLDFGDMVFAPRVFEIANAAAYALDYFDDAVAALAELVAAYHDVNPLSDTELAVIVDAVQIRYAVSISVAAKQIRQWPDNDYLLISQKQVWRNWQRLQHENPALVLARLRAQCGLTISDRAERVERWIRRNTARFNPVIALDFDCRSLQPLNWSASARKVDESTAQFMQRSLDEVGDAIAVGVFAEDRVIYDGDQYIESVANERRTIHLGLDLFASAGTAVFAALDGLIVEQIIDPNGFGGLLVIKHQSDNGDPFYLLYGHLDPDCFVFKTGDSVKTGQTLGTLGNANVNGGWAPHLHLQIIVDQLDIPWLQWPGVCSKRWWPVYKQVCLPPTLVMRLHSVAEQRHISDDRWRLQRQRDQHASRAQSLSYQDPLHIVAGQGCYLIDAQGTRWLDMVNNVCHVGHANPRVVAAASKQMATLNTNTRYLHDNFIEYQRRLCLTLPSELSVVFLVNSGSEANDLALRLARAYTQSRQVICVDHAYHGHLSSLIDISPYKFNGKGGAGKPAHTHIAEMPDLYRGRWQYGDATAGKNYANSVEQICIELREQGKHPGLFLVEAIQGCGGQVPLPEQYLQHVYPIVREAGGVVLSDEVQVGFGRVGSHMWAFETQHVVPDIVTMGKPIGNGHPLAAVVTRPEIAAAFANGMEYFNTYGGNPVSAAIGLAVLDEIEEQGLMAHAQRISTRLMDGLRSLAKQHPVIGDVRGIGLFIGVELVSNRDHKTPDAALLTSVIEAMKARRILLSSEGPFNNVLKIKPPLVFAEVECDYFLTCLDEVLRSFLG